MLQKLKLSIITAVIFTGLVVAIAPGSSFAATDPGNTGKGCGNSAAPNGTDCSTIPLGCPGSTQTGKLTGVNTLTCPYSANAGSSYKCPVKSCTFEDKAATATTTTPTDNGSSTTLGGNCQDINKCDLIKNYLNPFINLLSALIGVIVVVSVAIGGIQYTTSAGDPQKAAAARARIRNAVIALVTFIFLYSLLNFLIPGGLV